MMLFISNSAKLTDGQFRNGNFIDGSLIVITLNSAFITVELKGVPESFVNYTDTFLPDTSSWKISLASTEHADWMFYKQCDILSML